MAYQFGLAKQLAAGGESLSELDLIADNSYVLNKHESMAERGFDLRVDQVMQDETPQADQTFSNINKTWPLGVVAVGLPDKRRISSITFRAFLGSPVIDGVLIVRRGAEPFYRRALGAISDVSDTTFDLTAAGMVPIDLFDMTVYTMSIVSQSGMDINLAGNNSDRPFYSWEFHELISEDMAYDSDLNPVVKGGIEGIEFDEAMSLHPGGDSTFQTDHVIEKISALVMHPVEDERAADRFMDVASRADDEPVFIVFADILTNPSFPFQVGDDARLLDVQVMSAGAQTNVMFKVFDQSSGKLVWSSMIGTMPSFGTVKIDFTDTTESNVPIDIFNSRVYTFDFSSEDGDVLLLGDDTPDPDQPWLTASFIPFFDETIAYLADLTSSTGVFNVDKSTTIPEENRDGTVFRPYKTINEALTDIGPATIDTQHTLILASADYDEDFTLPIFTHLLNPAHDPDSVHFNTVTVDEVGGQMSITRCRFDTLEYDTSGDATASTTVLSIVSSSIVNAVNITGRGAASDKIMIDQFDTFNTLDVTNILLIIQNSFSTAFAAALNFNATNAAINPLGGIECVIDIQSLTTPGAANSNMTSTLANLMFTAKNSVLPDYLVVGPNVTIARDANTVFDISGPATIVNLDISKQVEYDNTLTGIDADNAQDAIDISEIAAQLAGSGIVNGSADIVPVKITEDTVTTYNVSEGNLIFIDDVDPLNHERIVKNFPEALGVTLNLIGQQRNVFLYLDVADTPPSIFESLEAPQRQLDKNLVTIGNIDLIDAMGSPVGSFDEIQGVNQFVEAAYSLNDRTNLLHKTRQNFNVFGSIFSAAGGNLKVVITPGRGIRIGVNIQNDYRTPDLIDDLNGEINNVNMQWVDSNGVTQTQFQGMDGPLDVAHLVLVGADVPTLVTANNFTIIYLFKFYGSNSIRGHFGDQEYNTQAAAIAAVKVTGPAIPSDQTVEAQLRGAVVVKQNTLDLAGGENTFIAFP